MGVFIEPAERCWGWAGGPTTTCTAPAGRRPLRAGRRRCTVKYASHALRLAYQGLQIARDAHLTLSMPPVERERVLAVKRGDVQAKDTVLTEIATVQSTIEELPVSGRTPLPEQPGIESIAAWSVSAHRRRWLWT